MQAKSNTSQRESHAKGVKFLVVREPAAPVAEVVPMLHRSRLRRPEMLEYRLGSLRFRLRVDSPPRVPLDLRRRKWDETRRVYELAAESSLRQFGP